MEGNGNGMVRQAPSGYRHYLRLDSEARIIHGFSTAFEAPEEGDILLREDAGRQFRLAEDGEENPPLCTAKGVPLYQCLDGAAEARPGEDVQADEDALPGTAQPDYFAFIRGLMEGYDG